MAAPAQKSWHRNVAIGTGGRLSLAAGENWEAWEHGGSIGYDESRKRGARREGAWELNASIGTGES